MHVRYAAPMVCFCDIPLSQVKDHMLKYGSYGIGLTKEWARKNGLNPVLYIDQDSELINSYFKIYNSIPNVLDDENQTDSYDSDFAVLDLIRYMKNYEGILHRRGVINKKYRFSDEREWRFIPKFDGKHQPILNGDILEIPEIKFEMNLKLDYLKLNFEPTDVKYLIIKSESEISDLVNLLKKSKTNNYNPDEIERLTTRILSSDQIFSDF